MKQNPTLRNAMIFRLLLVGLLICPSVLLAQPANDNTSTAVDISNLINNCSPDGAFTTMNASADFQSGTCSEANADFNVWFKFKASTDFMNVVIKTGGTYGTIKAINLAIWGDGPSTEIACNIYSDEYESVEISTSALIPGNWYYISVDNSGAQNRGSFTLCLEDSYYIKSAQSGDWTSASSWKNGILPNNSSNVKILSGHTINLNINEVINNLCIEDDAILNNSTNSLNISGAYINDGKHSGSGNDNIILSGSNTTITGTGNITHSGNILISSGNKSISANANLHFTAGISMSGSLRVSNLGTVKIEGNLSGNNPGSIWANESGSVLKIGGNILINSGTTGTFEAMANDNSVVYNGFTQQIVTVPSGGTYYNLKIEGGNIKTLAGSLTINNDLIIESNLDCINHLLTIKGDLKSNGTFYANTGTVLFNGTTDQTVLSPTGISFYNLSLDNSGGNLISGNSIFVKNNLTMTEGNIDVTSSFIRLGESITMDGTLNWINGTIFGSFERWVTSTVGGYYFPVGSQSTGYPVEMSFVHIVSGTVAVEFHESFTENAGIPFEDSSRYVNDIFTEGYWSITTNNGFFSTDFDLQLTGTNFTSLTFDALTGIVRRPPGANEWTSDGRHVSATGNIVKRSSMTMVNGEYAIVTACLPPATSSITGNLLACAGTSEDYSVVANSGNVYNWSITGGTISSGQGTNSITVDWDAAGGRSYLVVTENNGCSNAIPMEINLVTQPALPDTIWGYTNIGTYSTGVVYHVEDTSDYIYDWTLSANGTGSGSSTGSETIQWSSTPGPAYVGLIATHPTCGTSPLYTLPVQIYTEFVSKGSGAWNEISTWWNNAIPTPTDKVKISNGHNVFLTNQTIIDGLIIEGVLEQNNVNLTVSGTYINRGTHITGTGLLIMEGTDQLLDGDGYLDLGGSGSMQMQGGNKYFKNTSNLSIYGNIEILSDIHVTNNGGISVQSVIGSDPSSVWVNADGSILSVSDELLLNGSLDASYPDNIITYYGVSDQLIKIPINDTLYHLNINSFGTSYLTGDIVLKGDLNITGPLDVSPYNYSISIMGNWYNNSSFNAGAGKVTFAGLYPQFIGGAVPTNFAILELDNTSGGEALELIDGLDQIVDISLVLTDGIINTNGNKLIVNTPAPSAINGYSQNSFVAGNLRRAIASNNFSYPFPVGTSPDTNSFFPAYFINNGLLGVSFLDVSPGYIQEGGNNGDYMLNLHENGAPYRDVISEIIWNFTPDAAPTSGSFGIKLAVDNIYGLEDNKFFVLRRPSSSTTYADWTNDSPTTTFPADGQPGRTIADGYAQRNGFTTFSQFAIARIDPLTNIFTNVNNISCFGVADGTVTAAPFGGEPPYSFLWSMGDTTATVAGLVAGSYYLTISDGFTSIADTIVLFQPALIPSPLTSNDTTYCEGDAIENLTVTGSGINWYTDSDFNNNIGSFNNLTITPGIGINNYYVTQSLSGCESDYSTIVITLNQSPSVTNHLETLCEGSPLSGTVAFDLTSLNSTVSNGSNTIAWNSDADGTAISSPTSYTVSDGFSVYANVSNGNCSLLATVDFQLNSMPYAIDQSIGPLCEDTLNAGFHSGVDLSTFNNSINNSTASPVYWYEDPLAYSPVANPYNDTVYDNQLLYAVVENGNCRDTAIINFNVNGLPVISSVSGNLDIACFGDYDGSINITVPVSADGNSYSWSNEIPLIIATTEDVTGLVAGIYTVNITDINGCESTKSITISEPSEMQLTPSSINVFCNGGNNGTASVSIIGGTSPWSLIWDDSNNSTSNTVTNLLSGTYNVTVSDINGCQKSTAVFVDEPTPLSSDISYSNVSCFGFNDGSANVIVTGGSSPYFFVWNAGIPTTTSYINNISAGFTYRVTITDNNGCSLIDFVHLSDPEPIKGNIQNTDVSCFGLSDGTAEAFPSGGNSGYSYQWSDIALSTAYNIANLQGNTNYYVTITDSQFCMGIDSIYISEPLPITISYNTVPETCSLLNGAATIQATGGISPYGFVWSNGSSTANILGLQAANYSITVTDSKGCAATEIVNIAGIQEGVLLLSSTDNDCFNGQSGSATAVVNGGTSPFNFEWSNGESSSSISNLINGFFSVTVVDANECVLTENVTITSPDSISISVTTTNTDCSNNDGTASVTVTGGTSPYYYLWSSGSPDADETALASGMYMVTVTDNQGCQNFMSVSIDNTNAPSVTFTRTNVSCYNGSNGKIKINLSGGNPPFHYEWSNGASGFEISGLVKGPYEVTITDNYGCKTSKSTNLTQADKIVPVVSVTEASCLLHDGSATASATGGYAPYSFWWSSGQLGNTATFLGAGVYTVTVSDQKGCTVEKAVDVSNPNGPSIKRDNVSGTACGDYNGQISITSSGGVPPYSFKWSNGSVTEDISGVAAGNYNLSVTDNAGCIAATQINIPAILPATNPICLVTVDPLTNQNLVVWEKVQIHGLSHYSIYRESTVSGMFHLIGSTIADSLSVLADTISDPTAWSHHYKLSATDLCNNESNLSDHNLTVHKTIHLAAKKINTDFRLTWNHYTGFGFEYYYIYRHTNSEGTILLDSVISTQNIYTDPTPDENGLYYYVEIKNADECIATDGNKTTYNYNTSRSNSSGVVAPDGIAHIEQFNHSCFVYPNPNAGEFFVLTDDKIKGNTKFYVYDIYGRLIIAETKDVLPGGEAYHLDISNRPRGTYIIRVISGNEVYNGRVVYR